MIGVITLLVVGPERLPRVARTAGHWAGKMRQMLANVKAEVDREIHAEELKRVMQEQAKSSGVYEIVEETKEAARETRESIDETRAAAEELQRREDEYVVKAVTSTETQAIADTSAEEPGAPANPSSEKDRPSHER